MVFYVILVCTAIIAFLVYWFVILSLLTICCNGALLWYVMLIVMVCGLVTCTSQYPF